MLAFEELLQKFDDPLNVLHPSGFDWVDAKKRAKYFADALSCTLGLKLVPDSTAEDATFHTEIPIPLPDGTNAYLRFSNFGNLVAVGREEDVSAEALAGIQDVAAVQGYRYLPWTVLDQKYTGQNPCDFGWWWTRYFDYV